MGAGARRAVSRNHMSRKWFRAEISCCRTSSNQPWASLTGLSSRLCLRAWAIRVLRFCDLFRLLGRRRARREQSGHRVARPGHGRRRGARSPTSSTCPCWRPLSGPLPATLVGTLGSDRWSSLPTPRSSTSSSPTSSRSGVRSPRARRREWQLDRAHPCAQPCDLLTAGSEVPELSRAKLHRGQLSSVAPARIPVPCASCVPPARREMNFGSSSRPNIILMSRGRRPTLVQDPMSGPRPILPS
jgi:hypothetical protein